MKKKITYIVSNIDKVIAFEWIALNIDKSKFELSFIILNNKTPYLHEWLKKHNINSCYISHYGKKSYPSSFFKVLKTLNKTKPDIVHTHLFDANLIGLFSAKILGIKKRIYTRHHSTFHHDNFPKAVKYDLWSNKMATNIVAISENVKKVLISKEKVNEDKIKLIHHGFDLEKFNNVPKSEIAFLKEKYKINNQLVIGVISRYIEWKGIQYIIPAFKNILKTYPNAILVLANAKGPNKKQIKNLLKELPKKNYREIEFESNLFALYKLFDVYVHTPIDSEIEAFGQTYVEALASGIPSIFTLSGVANEFIEDKKNAIVVKYKSSKEIETSIFTILDKNKNTTNLIKNGKNSVEKFNLEKFITNLEKLYY